MRRINGFGWWALLGLALNFAGGPAIADVVPVVSTKSVVTTLTKAQLTAIFLGQLSRFPTGSLAMPIDQTEGSAIRDEFYAKFAGKSATQLKAFWSKIIFTGRGRPPIEVSSDIEMKKRIRENPAAIGYIDQTMVDDSVKVVLQPL